MTNGPDTHPHLCWSRHSDNIGKPRPEARWTLTYSCQNGHEVTANVCDRCASSLVDGRQHCVVCIRGMVVTSLTEYAEAVSVDQLAAMDS